MTKLTQDMQKKLHTYLIETMKKEQLWSNALETELPKKWEKHGNMVLFPATALSSDIWRSAGDEVWEQVCSILHVSKVARKTGPIRNDDFRRPCVEMLYGDNSWVTKKENGIMYSWDIRKSMFCSGNISEKQRIATLDCTGKTVLDLYAGIGYFTLSYLIHAKADLVYAIEWNPDAVAALNYNLRQNKVEDKCIVLQGNNLEVCPSDVADHVNLGLLPSSERSWSVACRALKRSGGVLHIHGNVDLKIKEEKSTGGSMPTCTSLPDSLIGAPVPWVSWIIQTKEKIVRILESLYGDEKWGAQVLFLHKVKSYGPHIDHLVLDLKCTPLVPYPNRITDYLLQ